MFQRCVETTLDLYLYGKCNSIYPYIHLMGPNRSKTFMAGQLNLPPATKPPKRNKGLTAGLIKGNQWVFISPDHKGPLLFLGEPNKTLALGGPKKPCSCDPKLGAVSYFCLKPLRALCARVKSPYIGDGHPTFNRASF